MMNNDKMGFDGGSKQLNNGYKFDVETAAADVAAEVDCSICWNPVSDDGKRSWAKLQCNHRFHLDCIGSAFNAKGVMECPNCRKVEEGEWLFANGKNQSRGDNPILDLHQSFLDESHPDLDDLALEFQYLSALYSLGESSSLPTFTHLPPAPYNGAFRGGILHATPIAPSGTINPASYDLFPIDEVLVTRASAEHDSIPMHRWSRGGYEQQRATPVYAHHSATSERSVTTPPETRFSVLQAIERAQALDAIYQQSINRASMPAYFGSSGSRSNNIQNNAASTLASFGSYGSRSNNSQNNNTRFRNVPPYPSNHAATNHLQSNSSLGRDYYHHQEQVHDGYDYEPHMVRPQSTRPRSEFVGSRHSQNQGWK